MRHPVERCWGLASDGRQLEHHQPDEADQHEAHEQRDKPHAGRADLHFHRRPADRADGEVVLLADLGLGHDYLGITVNGTGCNDSGCSYMQDLATRLPPLAPRPGNWRLDDPDPPVTMELRCPLGLPARRTAAGRY